MASAEHQRLVNILAKKLESHGVTLTHIDIAGTPEYFDTRYRSFPSPPWYNNHSPDLQGMKEATVHVGEAEVTLDNPSVAEHLVTFSNVIVEGTEQYMPFHIIVPRELEPGLYKKIQELGLHYKVRSGQITVWTPF
jgi:hypothetical protein